MSVLKISRKSYRAALREKWESGHYECLPWSKSSKWIRKMLSRKAKTRLNGQIRQGKKGSRRFFGEAYVATSEANREVWYNSFKWLMAPRYVRDIKLPIPQHRFRDALRSSFDLDQIRDLQAKSSILWSTHREMLGGKKPVPPDLWLVADRGRHRFIEVKLPKDTIKPHQLAGLALISTLLKDKKGRPVSVEIVKLFERPIDDEHRRSEKQLSARETKQFQAFRRAIGESRFHV